VSWELQLDARAPDGPWTVLSRRLGGDSRVLGSFVLLYGLLVALALLPPEPLAGIVIVWPAGGLLLLALWLSERRIWISILLLQVGLEVLLGSLLRGLTTPWLVAIAAHSVGGIVGALVVRRMLAGSRGVRVVALLRFAIAAASGAVIGAALQAIAAAASGAAVALAPQALMWTLAMLLGALSTLPTLMSWLVSHRFAGSFPPLTRMQRVELAVVLAVQLAVVVTVFSGESAGSGQLRFPVLVLIGLVYATVRLPPRWNMALLGGTAVLVLWLVARGGNPLGIPDTTARVLWIQLSILVFQLVVVGLSVYIAQSRIVMRELAATQSRYRSFIELSTEAVWRVELDEPMPVDLPQPEQIEWLRHNARVAEASASFGRIAGGNAPGAQQGWIADLPWVQVFEAHIEQLRQHGFSADDLRFAAIAGGRVRTYLTSFSGVVRDGRLERIWGVARDVTDMFELNARLMREQELLRSYAQRIVGAEEGARRSTAAELHNGIGQELVAMGMMLTVLGGQLPPQHRVQVDEFRGRLHRVQQRTRDMISDLSPPGLYDLGLVPALQWLVVYLRTHENIKVGLEGSVEEAAISTELRVLVFRLVREMLRNVVKHAGVEAAFLKLSGDKTRLLVEVRDEGKGFDWHPDQIANPKRGLGLWSIANRLREVGGQLSVESAPGRGTRLTMEVPLVLARGASASRSAS
jgi:signal transduction histidine kinase